ncbi:putative secreted protein (Por secretion system target) [Chryseobacterium sp. 52]|uniref:T9SS type A sorting domain-containing protein n=1 Tax=Chryseobacterium sp. 52 TaxID=2035213 RepID=UPI000C18C9A4|nr:T9SS type A sorting domain-containing protein [Chryseobacterium sp. 52]PIF47551.1 putative secreted protein (Por secretion system target) [Chryseobacterium sp. 52]
MKKVLLILSVALANFAWAQFTTGTVSLPAAGMTAKITTTATQVTLTLTGDSNSMLGIGFGGNGVDSGGMANGSDGFIYSSATARDYTFIGMTTPTADAAQDWTVTSNTIAGTTRTIVATRSLTGGTGDFAFANTTSSINVFYARRFGNLGLGYHGGDRDYAVLSRTVLGTSEAVAESKKTILYPNPAKEMVSFKNADKVKSVDIYESAGRKVKSVKPDGENIDVRDLKPGIYYFEITLKDGSMSYEKLIKE